MDGGVDELLGARESSLVPPIISCLEPVHPYCYCSCS